MLLSLGTQLAASEGENDSSARAENSSVIQDPKGTRKEKDRDASHRYILDGKNDGTSLSSYKACCVFYTSLDTLLLQ